MARPSVGLGGSEQAIELLAIGLRCALSFTVGFVVMGPAHFAAEFINGKGWDMRATKFVCLLALGGATAFSSGCNSGADQDSQVVASAGDVDPIGSEPEASAVESAEPINQQEQTEMSEAEESTAELTLAQALDRVNDGTAVLVDVRSDDEWNASHFAQAKHIPIDKISEDASAACESLNKDQLVLLH